MFTKKFRKSKQKLSTAPHHLSTDTIPTTIVLRQRRVVRLLRTIVQSLIPVVRHLIAVVLLLRTIVRHLIGLVLLLITLVRLLRTVVRHLIAVVLLLIGAFQLKIALFSLNPLFEPFPPINY